MNKLRFIVLLLTVSTFVVFTSCGDSEDEKPSEETEKEEEQKEEVKEEETFTKHLTWTLEGKDYASQLPSYKGYYDDTVLYYQSDQSQEEQVFLEFPKNVSPGVYSLPAQYFNFKCSCYLGSISSPSREVVNGKYTITYHDTTLKKIKGTFEVAMKSQFQSPADTVYFTKGSFAFEYRDPI